MQVAQAALASNQCVVIGLQSTGESHTRSMLDQAGRDADGFLIVDHFISSPREILLQLMDHVFPRVRRPGASPTPPLSVPSDDTSCRRAAASAA